jgi:hypothetical protein
VQYLGTLVRASRPGVNPPKNFTRHAFGSTLDPSYNFWIAPAAQVGAGKLRLIPNALADP